MSVTTEYIMNISNHIVSDMLSIVVTEHNNLAVKDNSDHHRHRNHGTGWGCNKCFGNTDDDV